MTKENEVERRAVVASKVGLHARPAGVFTQAVKASGLSVAIAKTSGPSVNAASPLMVMSLGIGHGDEVVLTADGDGAEAALASLVTLLETDHD